MSLRCDGDHDTPDQRFNFVDHHVAWRRRAFVRHARSPRVRPRHSVLGTASIGGCAAVGHLIRVVRLSRMTSEFETVITDTERRLNYHDTNARFAHIGGQPGEGQAVSGGDPLATWAAIEAVAAHLSLHPNTARWWYRQARASPTSVRCCPVNRTARSPVYESSSPKPNASSPSSSAPRSPTREKESSPEHRQRRQEPQRRHRPDVGDILRSHGPTLGHRGECWSNCRCRSSTPGPRPRRTEPVRLLRAHAFGWWAESMIAQYNAPDK